MMYGQQSVPNQCTKLTLSAHILSEGEAEGEGEGGCEVRANFAVYSTVQYSTVVESSGIGDIIGKG